MKRNFNWAYLLAISLAFGPINAKADTFSFNNITSGDYDAIVKEMSANFNYTSVTPASSLGVWGFEFGAVASTTKVPEILNLVKRASPSTTLKDNGYNAGGLLRLSVPFGITAEAEYLPEISASSAKIKSAAGALQWTVTDMFFTDLPVTLATKFFYTKSTLSFSQTISSVNSTLSFEDKIYGAQAKVSKKLLVFEPYAVIGYAKANGNLTVTAGTTIFGQDLAGRTSATSKPNSAVLAGGVDIQLLFFSLGAEYSKAFGTHTLAARTSFRF